MRVNLGEAKHVNPSMICRRNSECPPKSLSILHLSGTTSGTSRTTTWWSPQSGVTLGASSRDSTWNMSRGWDVLVIVGYCNLSQFLTQMSGPLWHLFEPIWTHLNPSGPLWHPSERLRLDHKEASAEDRPRHGGRHALGDQVTICVWEFKILLSELTIIVTQNFQQMTIVAPEFKTNNIFGALIRFLHDPKATVGFVGCALFSNMFRIFKTEKVNAHSF